MRNAFDDQSGVTRASVLENGLRIVTQALPGSGSVSLGLLVGCGSRDEEPGEEGLAHLSEHLMFQGTSSRAALDIARQIDGIGGQVGAFTTRDYTCYFAAVPRDYAFHALDLLADLLLNSIFPPEALERERGAVACELAASDEDPSDFLQQEVKRTAWQGHRLARPVAGLPESLARHSREAVIYFVHRHYTPDRIILAAAGGLDHDDFVAQSRDCFWRMMGQSKPAPASGANFRPGFWLGRSPGTQCRFCVAIAAPAYGDSRRYDFHVLSQVLGGGVSSRLFRRLREEMGLVYDVQSEYLAYREAGMLVVETSAAASDASRVLDVVLTTLAGLSSGADAATDEELWVAKLRLAGLHQLGAQDPHTVMSRLATQEFYFGRQVAPEHILDEVNRVSLESLQQSVRDFIGVGRPEVAFAGLVPSGAAAWG